MVPTAYILLYEFPLNNNGKIDRKQLPKPLNNDFIDNDSNNNQTYIGPINELDKAIHSIYCNILKIIDPLKLSMNSNFFNAGGNSLLAMNLLAKLKQLQTSNSILISNNCNIDIGVIFTYNTPSKLCNYIINSKNTSDNKSNFNYDNTAITVTNLTSSLSSHAQQRIYLHDEINKLATTNKNNLLASMLYNMPGIYSLLPNDNNINNTSNHTLKYIIIKRML